MYFKGSSKYLELDRVPWTGLYLGLDRVPWTGPCTLNWIVFLELNLITLNWTVYLELGRYIELDRVPWTGPCTLNWTGYLGLDRVHRTGLSSLNWIVYPWTGLCSLNWTHGTSDLGQDTRYLEQDMVFQFSPYHTDFTLHDLHCTSWVMVPHLTQRNLPDLAVPTTPPDLTVPHPIWH